MAEEKELELEDVALDDKGSGSKKMIILMVVGGLLLVALSVGLTLFLLGGDDSDAEEAAAEDAVPQVEKLSYYEFKPFTVNFQQGNRTRLLQVQVNLSTRSSDVHEALELHAPLIKHTIVTILSGRDFESLRTTAGKEDLRQTLLDAVQEVVQQETGQPGLENVLFTRFVMQ